LETGHLTTDPERNSLAGNRQAINGSATYCQTTLPRQSPTLHGRFYKSRLMNFLEQRINPFLVKWAMRKYKRLRRAKGKTRRKLAEIASAFPGMFAHWRHGAMPTGSTVGAV
ncbi:MAG: hypothetical protein ACRDTH_25665, partial [Pseudonocardiaceae bacterium]